ncbi:MAG: DUF58 domain-containing protein [Lachnospiraceae bacterium]
MTETIFDPAFFERLRAFRLALAMHLSDGMSGNRKSSARGSSVEFSDFRAYLPGDDIRRIDWNAYGRTDKLYIKQFMEEKEGVYQIFLDTSRSMTFGEKAKSDMALQTAAALSYLILQNLDRVSINELRENTSTKGKGLTGRAAFPNILDALKRVTFDGKTTLSKSLLSRPMQNGQTAIIISDFLDGDGIEQALKYLAYRRQTIVLIQILAPEECDPIYEGTLELKDIETDEKLRITMTNKVVATYQNTRKKWQNHLVELSRHYGATYLFLRSDSDLFEELLHQGNGLLQGR